MQDLSKRSQVEAALWRALYVASHAAPADPPLVFLTRVRRLLDPDARNPARRRGRGGVKIALFADVLR